MTALVIRRLLLAALVLLPPLLLTAGCGSDHGHRNDQRAAEIEAAKQRQAWTFD